MLNLTLNTNYNKNAFSFGENKKNKPTGNTARALASAACVAGAIAQPALSTPLPPPVIPNQNIIYTGAPGPEEKPYPPNMNSPSEPNPPLVECYELEEIPGTYTDENGRVNYGTAPFIDNFTVCDVPGNNGCPEPNDEFDLSSPTVKRMEPGVYMNGEYIGAPPPPEQMRCVDRKPPRPPRIFPEDPTQVPEPSTLALVGTGMALLGAGAAVRRSSQPGGNPGGNGGSTSPGTTAVRREEGTPED